MGCPPTRRASAVRAAPTNSTRSPTTIRGFWTASSRAARSPRSASRRSTSLRTPGCSTHTSTARQLCRGVQSRCGGSPGSCSTRQHRTSPVARTGSTRSPARRATPQYPASDIYDAVSNPRGVRCTVYDHTVNVYGRDPATGFALRPLDNVGIQYGLGTLNASVISVDQFLDLNEKIGGFDRDATIVPQRTVADLSAARAAYQTGRLTSGRGGLASVPIIDFRDYNDALPGGDIHVRYHSFSMRKRLDKANGRHDNQLMVVNDNRFGLYSTANPLLREAILKMDRWITAVKADTRDIREIDKVVENKPADVQEGCYSRDPTPVFIAHAHVREQEATR